MKSRTFNTMRNMVISQGMQIINVLLLFVCRTIFVNSLPPEYLGISGLFSNIIAVLSLSELGFSNVIIVSLYKPLAQDDRESVARLMNFYAKVYSVIGILVVVVGIALVPFLPYLAKSETEIPYLWFYFLLFIFQTAASYFYSYKHSMFTVDQKEYICTVYRQISSIAMNICQSVALMITSSYALYLVLGIVFSVGMNVVISHKADKEYPYLRHYRRLKIEDNERIDIYKKTASMFVHRVSNVVIGSTDNLLISSFLGVIFTGLYSNYLLIINSVNQIISTAFNAVSASLGNYSAVQSKEDTKKLFDAMYMLGDWIYGFAAICFLCLFQPWIKLWLGSEYLLELPVVVVLSINYYISGIMRIPSTFIDVTGLYNKTTRKSICIALVNLISSLVLLRYYGLLGVFLGTLLGYVVGIWFDPIVLAKDFFKLPASSYFIKLVVDMFVTVAIGAIVYYVCWLVESFILKIALCLLIINCLYLVRFMRTAEFGFVLQRIKNLFVHRAS